MKIITLVLGLILISYGVYLDAQAELSQAMLTTAFYTASLLGILSVSLFFMIKRGVLWRSVLSILLAFIIWRISFFPIMVLAGFMTTWGEFISMTLFSKSVIYPFLLIFVAMMNAVALWLAEISTGLIIQPTKKASSSWKWSVPSLLITTLPLGVLAMMISFTHPVDWHSIPNTSFIDNKPLPRATLPEINPYGTALEADSLSLSHKILFKAAAITYDWIPEGTQWSQVVKGVLEKEFLTTSDVSTSFCSKIHYRAFMTAQPFIKQRTIQELSL